MEDRGYPRRSSNTPHYVMYFGTFTKMLFNALRHGFMVSPERLVEAFVDRHPPTISSRSSSPNATLAIMSVACSRPMRTAATFSKPAADKDLNGVLDAVHAGSGMRTLGWLKTWNPITTLCSKRRSSGSK